LAKDFQKEREIRSVWRATTAQVANQLKKLRYSMDFFALLFPGRKPTKKRRTMAKALKRLQSNLGDLNDFAAHGKLTKKLGLLQE